MGAPLSPPPWEDIARLLIRASVMYAVFFALAVFRACTQRPSLRRLRVEPKPEMPYGLANLFSVAAVTSFANRYGFQFALARMVVSTGVCVVYVYNTYMGYISKPILIFQRIVGLSLSAHLVGMLLVSLRPIEFVVCFESLFEVLSLSSLIVAKPADWLNFSFLQAYVVLSRYFHIEKTLELMLLQKHSPFHRQLSRLTLEFIAFIYAFACGLQLFELLGDPTEHLTATTFELTFANSLYFTVVTIFTVGYGDFVPYTLLGRLWIISIIFFGAYLVSMKIGQVMDVVSGIRNGLGSFVKGEGIDHCVICGNVKWEYLKSFVQEFYGDSRNDGKKLVVICDQPNWTEETWNKFFAASQFRDNVVYLEGSCVSRDDLVRAQVETALAIFVLNNQHNPDPYAEDSETLKRILTIRSYTPNLPIYSMCALRDSMLQITYALENVAQIEAEEGRSSGIGGSSGGINVLSQEARGQGNVAFGAGAFQNESGVHPATAYYSRDFSEDEDDDGLHVPTYDGSSDLKSEALCMQEIEMALLAENVFCNGLSTLLANLILRVNPQTKPTDQPWAVEYKIGSECRFEYVQLPRFLHNKKFSEIALIMYDYGVLLIATKRFMDKKWKAITPETVIQLNTIGLIITFHSTSFLGHIMDHIAARVSDEFEDTFSERSSRGVPSIDDEFGNHRSVPRSDIAGDLLTGDVPLAYEWPADELVTQPPRVQPAAATNILHSVPSLTEAYSPNVAISQKVHGGIVTQQPLAPAPANPAPTVKRRDSEAIPAVQQSQQAAAAQFEHRGPSAAERSLSGGPDLHSLRLDLDLIENTAGADTSDENDSEVPSGSYSHYKSQLVPTKGSQPILELAEVAPSATQDDADEMQENSQLPQPADDIDDILDSEEVPVPAGPAPGIYSRVIPRRKTKGKPHVSFHQKNKTKGLTQQTDTGSDKASIGKMRKGDGYSSDEQPKKPMIFFGEDDLPVKVKGHIVVCAIGHMAVVNLKHFLHRVWMKRGSSEGDTPVVAICPRLSDEEESQLCGFASKRLFLIQGNSLSVKTLRRAQFEQAKAIVVLACEDKNDVDHMDAKAIFTVMTLDYLLGERSETFVCTMLDAEESMQLLRAPAHARRRGTDLGRAVEEYLQFGISQRSMSGYFSAQSANYRSLHSSRSPGGFDDPRAFGERTLSFGALSGTGELPRSMSFVGVRNSTYTDRKEAIGRAVGIENTSLYTEAKRLPSNSSFGRYRSLADDEDDILNNASHGGVSALNFLMNPSTMTMGAGVVGGDGLIERGRGAPGQGGSRARDELFEKQRYASGEMMISSTYTSLLIREYAMPGLMAVVRKIFGAGMGKTVRSKRCWVRTIHIPRQWILSSPDGRRTYREVFEVLLQHGAIALGLYRSGDVVVRQQVEVDPGLESEEGVTSRNTSNGEENPLASEGLSRETATRSFTQDSLDVMSDDEEESPTFEFGGASAPRCRPSRSQEGSRLMQDVTSYGATNQVLPNTEGGAAQTDGTDESDRAARVNISSYLLFDVADRAPRLGEVPETHEEFETYVCPTSGRTAMFKEVPGGDNVLPYVYTNPEAYTLVSEHDAVYVLISPTEKIPEDW